MAAKKKSKFENKFKSTVASESRTANVRDERKVKDEQPKLGPLEKVCGYRSTIKILFCPFIKLNNG